jgi:outer membrane protein TolC
MIRFRCLAATLAAVLLLPVGARAQAGSQAAGQAGAAQVFTLDQALQYAAEHYPSVRAAFEQVNASTANVNVAKSAYLPRFDSLWQMNRATANNVFGQLLPQPVIPSISGPVLPSASGNAVWGSALGGLLSWEPFDFGLRGAGVREAEAGVLRARAEEDRTRLVVQQAVGAAFLNLVSAEQSASAAEVDVQRREVLARAARTLADNELRPGAEASRAAAELAAAQTRAIQTRQAVAVARSTLSQLLGVDNVSISVNAGGLIDAVARRSIAPGPVSEHPAVESGRAAIELARARETVLAKTDWPRIYLQSAVSGRGSGANVDGTFDGGGSGWALERANWAAGVQVVFPNLFDFSSLRARRAAAGALTRAESARYDEAVLTVTSQQRTADALVQAAVAVADNSPVVLAAAQQSETQARARYEAGLGSIVEVADAQNLLAQAEYQDAVARVEVWRALLAQAAAQGSIARLIDLLRSPGVP